MNASECSFCFSGRMSLCVSVRLSCCCYCCCWGWSFVAEKETCDHYLWMRASAVLNVLSCVYACVREWNFWFLTFWKKNKSKPLILFCLPKWFCCWCEIPHEKGMERQMNEVKVEKSVSCRGQVSKQMSRDVFQPMRVFQTMSSRSKVKSLQKQSQDKKILRLNAIVSGSNC